MAKMREALEYLYKGQNAISRQICLFSICGLVGLINGYMALVEQFYNEASIYLKIVFASLIILFGFFIVGFETEFLHTRKIPDTDLNVLKTAAKKNTFYYIFNWYSAGFNKHVYKISILGILYRNTARNTFNNDSGRFFLQF